MFWMAFDKTSESFKGVLLVPRKPARLSLAKSNLARRQLMCWFPEMHGALIQCACGIMFKLPIFLRMLCVLCTVGFM